MRNAFHSDPPIARIILNPKTHLEALLDDADLPRAAEVNASWRAVGRAGKLFVLATHRRYDAEKHLQIAEDVLLHRWLLRAGAQEQILHRNGDALDCRRQNLEVRLLARPRLSRPWEACNQRSQEQHSLAWFAELRRRLEAARVSPRISPAQALGAIEDLRAQRFPSSRRLADLIDTIQAGMLREGLRWPAPPRARLRSAWQHHIGEIEAELLALPPHHPIGREDVERIFRLSRASASRLLAMFGATRFGNVYMIDAGTLAARLQRLEAEPLVASERHRHQRVLETVQSAARDQSARKVILPPSPAVAGFPDGVVLRRGELTIRFSTAEEAMSRMLALGLQAQENWEEFARTLEEGAILDQTSKLLDV